MPDIDQAIDAAMTANTGGEEIGQDSAESHESDVSEDNGRGSTRSMGETTLERVTKDAYRRIFSGDRSDISGARANAREQIAARNQEAQQAQPSQESQQSHHERAVDPHRVPDSWSKESRAIWARLPPAVQAAVNEREAQFRDAYAVHRNKVQFAEAVERMVQPHYALLQRDNIDPRAIIRDGYQGIAILHFGTNDAKVALLRQIVKDFNVIIPRPGQQQLRDPRVDAILQEQHAQRVHAQQQHQAAEQQKWQSANSEIENFARSKDTPHFAAVQGEMAQLLQSGQARTLKEAYSKAVAGNKSIQAKLAEQAPAKHMSLAQSRPADLPHVAGKERAAKIEDVALATLRKTGGQVRKI